MIREVPCTSPEIIDFFLKLLKHTQGLIVYSKIGYMDFLFHAEFNL